VAIENHYLNWADELIAEGAAIGPGMGDRVNWHAYCAWVTKAENFLLQVVGAEHIYYTRFHDFAQPIGDTWEARASALQQLMAFRDDLAKGRLVSLQSMVTAEVFSNFLDMAEHLLNNNYKDAAASLTGAVLERGLRDIADSQSIPVRSRDDLTSLANRLAEKAIYTRLMQKNLVVWIAVRNHADHGEFSQYTLDDVRNMLVGVRTFLDQHRPQ
jgi:hypothetical protein